MKYTEKLQPRAVLLSPRHMHGFPELAENLGILRRRFNLNSWAQSVAFAAQVAVDLSRQIDRAGVAHVRELNPDQELDNESSLR